MADPAADPAAAHQLLERVRQLLDRGAALLAPVVDGTSRAARAAVRELDAWVAADPGWRRDGAAAVSEEVGTSTELRVRYAARLPDGELVVGLVATARRGRRAMLDLDFFELVCGDVGVLRYAFRGGAVAGLWTRGGGAFGAGSRRPLADVFADVGDRVDDRGDERVRHAATALHAAVRKQFAWRGP